MDMNFENAAVTVVIHPQLEAYMNRHRPSKRSPINYKKGEKQTVYPIKKHEDILAMANWLYQNKDRKYLLAFILGINLGLRANELLTLRMNQIFNKDGSVRFIEDIEDTSDHIDIYQSKTHKYRTVFLNQACVDAIRWYFPLNVGEGCGLYSDAYLFPSREGGAIEVNTFRKVLKEAAHACGLNQNIGTHTLRKTWGWHQYRYNCDRANMDITMLQRAFGHSSSEVTLRYLGITDEEDKALYHNMCINPIIDEKFGF